VHPIRDPITSGTHLWVPRTASRRCGRQDQVNAANPRHVPGRSPRPDGRVKRPRWKHTSMYYAPLDDGRGWRLSFWGQKGSCVNG
jgi:hypothetical protein